MVTVALYITHLASICVCVIFYVHHGNFYYLYIMDVYAAVIICFQSHLFVNKCVMVTIFFLKTCHIYSVC